MQNSSSLAVQSLEQFSRAKPGELAVQNSSSLAVSDTRRLLGATYIVNKKTKFFKN